MEQVKKINNLESLSGKLKGKKVFLRADFNVPIVNGEIEDVYRIQSSLPTLRFLNAEGAITIIASHIETADIDQPTLEPVFLYMQRHFPQFSVSFCKDFLDKEVYKKAVDTLKEGQFLLLENIRNANQSGMSEKKDDSAFAEYLFDGFDFYVQDAFAVAHRAHTSVSALPKLFDTAHKVAGSLLYKEIESLSKALRPIKPTAVILSGMKFSTKLPLIKKYLETADLIFVGGALFNNVLRSMGYGVGVSLIDPEASYVDALVKDPVFKTKVFIPETVVVKNVLSGEIRQTSISQVLENESIQDIAEESVKKFFEHVEQMKVKTFIWNGPIGNYENVDFSKGTTLMTQMVYAYAEHNPESSVYIGGGDTVAAIQPIYPDFDKRLANVFVSTGGGAMLEFLEKDGKLPGIESLL